MSLNWILKIHLRLKKKKKHNFRKFQIKIQQDLLNTGTPPVCQNTPEITNFRRWREDYYYTFTCSWGNIQEVPLLETVLWAWLSWAAVLCADRVKLSAISMSEFMPGISVWVCTFRFMYLQDNSRRDWSLCGNNITKWNRWECSESQCNKSDPASPLQSHDSGLWCGCTWTGKTSCLQQIHTARVPPICRAEVSCRQEMPHFWMGWPPGRER